MEKVQLVSIADQNLVGGNSSGLIFLKQDQTWKTMDKDFTFRQITHNSGACWCGDTH